MQSINQQEMTILVTGANRGLGKDLARLLLKNSPKANLLLTTRKMTEELKHVQIQWHSQYPERKFQFKKLDLASHQSIDDFVEEVKKQNWTFDVIVNNAALGSDNGEKVPDPQWAKDTFATNVIGTIKLTESLLPLLNDNGRIVNVSSKMGALSYHQKPVQEEFNDPTLEKQQIYTAIEEYVALCESGDLGKWFASAYGTSKMFLNTWSRFILKRNLKPGQVSIAMSPGHCQTDMGGQHAPNSSESGAQSIYHCIFMQHPSFNIFYHRQSIAEYFNCG